MKLTENTILITGGSSGYGLELAKILVAKGNKVIICGRSEDKLKAAKKLNPMVEVFACDISIQDDRKKLYAYIRENHKELNILINNAAIVNSFNFEIGTDIIQKVEAEIQTNYIAPVALSKSFLPQLRKNRNAAIINITTGLVYSPKAKYPNYCASKAALHSFTQSIRYQLANSKIKIIEVLLPVVDTPFHNGNVPKGAISAMQAVAETIKGIEQGKEEIRVGMVKMMYQISKIAPIFISKKVNMI